MRIGFEVEKVGKGSVAFNLRSWFISRICEQIKSLRDCDCDFQSWRRVSANEDADADAAAAVGLMVWR